MHKYATKNKIFPFYKLKQEYRLRRQIKEEHFINIFMPKLNKFLEAEMTSGRHNNIDVILTSSPYELYPLKLFQ